MPRNFSCRRRGPMLPGTWHDLSSGGWRAAGRHVAIENDDLYMIYLWKTVIAHSYVYVNCQKVILFLGVLFSWICRDGMFIGRNMNDIIINPLRNINCQPSNPRSPSSLLDLLIFRNVFDVGGIDKPGFTWKLCDTMCKFLAQVWLKHRKWWVNLFKALKCVI